MDYILGATLITTVVAVLLCHHRFTRRQKISWGTLVASVLLGNVAAFLAFTFYHEGWDMFTLSGWGEPKGGWALLLVVFAVIAAPSILPALAVAVYYERRIKRVQNSGA